LDDYYNEKAGDEKVRRGKLIQAFEELVYQFPDELEAKAFLVFQLWDNQQHGVALPSDWRSTRWPSRSSPNHPHTGYSPLPDSPLES
jgi:hypothetical protein